MNKRTIVILTPGFPANEEDTTCIPFLQDYILAFAQTYRDINLQVVSFQYPFKRVHYKWHGIQVFCAGGRTRKGPLRLITWLRIWKELKLIKRQSGIDIIHSFWLTECTLIAQLFTKRSGIRHVAYAIGQDVLKTNKYLHRLEYQNMTIVAMSQSIADKFKSLTSNTVRAIISSGIDPKNMSIESHERTIDILGIGALSPLKNYSLFLDIIHDLKNDYPKISACIIGKGEQENMLKTKAKNLGIQGNVQFAGEVSHKEVFSYLNKSKIFLHTSGYEGQSTVIMEALATGLTSVCFDVGRLHAEGKVIVCSDKEEMIKQLKLLMSSELSYKPAITRTMDDMVNDFSKVYEL